MCIQKIKVRGNIYEYEDDLSWDKWKDIMTRSDIRAMHKLKWYRENVFITKPKTITNSIRLYKALENKFGFTDRDVKKFLKDVGKVGRGITVDKYTSKGIEFVVLKGMKGGIRRKDLTDMPFTDIIFFKRMLDVERQLEEDAIKNARRKK